MTPMFLAAALVVSAPQLKPAPAAADPQIGRWSTQELYINGAVSPQNVGLVYEFTKDGRWIIYRDGKVIDTDARAYKTEAKAKPQAIDLTEYGNTMPGIYKVEGDVLTVSIQTAKGAGRPTNFDVAPNGCLMLIMHRVKAK